MNRKTFPILIIIFLLTLVVTLIPEIIGDDMVQWCEENLKPIFGENYKGWLFGIIIIALVILTFLTTDLSPFSRSKNTDRPLNIFTEENEQNYQTIRQYLRQRYERRLNQKLAGRQPVNLRRIPTDEGTTEETSATFVTYKSEEIGPTLAHDFRESHGRLLVTGVPGAGKTTLLLQLALELNSTEKEYLPVLLNLATWSNEFNSLGEWLREILPAELGVTKKYAAEILKQDRLILLLDGFDEIKKEYRSACLEAIGIYGAEAGRRYIISSRKNEYNEVAKDAPVWLQVEVGPLSFEQLEAELKRIAYGQPEAPPLLQAFQKDPLLREAAQVPFYFNTLQLLFSGGKKLSDFNFKEDTVEGRQVEILSCFIERQLKLKSLSIHGGGNLKHWLIFLASNMAFLNKIQFELIDLQYYWHKWRKVDLVLGRMAYGLNLISIGVIGAYMIALFSYSLGLQKSLYALYLNISAVIFILGYSIYATIKNEVPYIQENTKSISFVSIVIGFFKNRNVIWILSGQLLAIVGRLIWGKPIIGTLKVFAYILIVSFFFYLMLALIKGGSRLLQITTPYQRFINSAKVLDFSIFQHWLLRWQLFKVGVLPLRLVDFLNEMVDRKILESDGATWRFRHKLIQMYFVKIWVEEILEKSKNTNEATGKTSSASSPPISSTKKI